MVLVKIHTLTHLKMCISEFGASDKSTGYLTKNCFTCVHTMVPV